MTTTVTFRPTPFYSLMIDSEQDGVEGGYGLATKEMLKKLTITTGNLATIAKFSAILRSFVLKSILVVLRLTIYIYIISRIIKLSPEIIKVK